MTSLHEAIAALADEWQKPDDGQDAGWLTTGVRYNCARELRDRLDRFPPDPAPSEDAGPVLTKDERGRLIDAGLGRKFRMNALQVQVVESILRDRLAKVEAERDSVQFALDGARAVARGDNEHLIARAEKAEVEAQSNQSAYERAAEGREAAEARADALARKCDDLTAISVETAQERDRLAEQVAAVETLADPDHMPRESPAFANRLDRAEIGRYITSALSDPAEALATHDARVRAEVERRWMKVAVMRDGEAIREAQERAYDEGVAAGQVWGRGVNAPYPHNPYTAARAARLREGGEGR